MHKAEEFSKPSEETASAEDKVAESSLLLSRSLPSHQPFVKCHQRTTLLSSWALLLGYNIFVSLMRWLPSATPNKF